MTFICGDRPDELTSQVFGKIRLAGASLVAQTDMQKAYNEIWQMKNRNASDDEIYEKIDDLRTQIGTLYFTLLYDIDAEIKNLYAITDNIGRCMWFCMVQRKCKPLRTRTEIT